MESEYVVCINNKGYAASLELKKIYKVINAPNAKEHNQLRVIDESGEDYLYPDNFFVPIKIPKVIENVFSHVA